MSTVIHKGKYYKIPNDSTVHVLHNGDINVNSKSLEEYPTQTEGQFIGEGASKLFSRAVLQLYAIFFLLWISYRVFGG